MKLEDMSKKFLNDVLAFDTIDTYKFYTTHLNNILRFMFERKIYNDEEITYDIICKFILYQKEKKLSNATINKRILALKRMFVFCKSSNVEVMNQIKKLYERKVNYSFLNDSDLTKLINYIETSSLKIRNKAILSIFIDTGVRINELVNIKINNLIINENMILLEQTKTKCDRYVFFTERTKKLLCEYLKTIKGDKLFDISKSGIANLFDRVKDSLGFIKFHPHMLRHTYATLLVRSNTNLEFIRLTMGHSNLTTTKRYLHCDLENMKHTYAQQFKLN